MQVFITKHARKLLTQLDPVIARRIIEKIEAYANDPASQTNNVRALRGRSGYRLRVGDYRVLFTLNDGAVTIMTVFTIGHRRDVYDE